MAVQTGLNGTETDKSIFVEAGAGSGKTTGLVARMIAMIGEGIDVSKICAITYTNAAAKEFYGRFQKELTKKIAEATDGDTREKYRNALKNIDLCFMGTIDSFCNMIVSEYPNRAAVPASASVITGDRFRERCRIEYEAIISGASDDPELKKKAELYCLYISKKDRGPLFEKLLEILISHRESDIVFDPPKGDPDNNFANEYASLKNLCTEILNAPQAVADTDKARGAFETLEECRRVFGKKLSECIGTVKFIVNTLKGLKLSSMPAGVAAADPGIFEKAPRGGYIVNEEKLNEYYGAFAEEQYSAAMDFVCSAINSIASRLRSRGELTFFDYLLYLRDMLRDDAANGGKLAKYISERYSCYLVDEFQDTDPLQAEIVYYLTAREPKEKWYECVPRPGSLYIVGDPKQSIYSFKGADVRSFMRVRELFNGDDSAVLKLTANHRSTPELCRWFNSTFTKLLPSDTADNCKFDKIPVDSAAKDTATTGVYYYNTYKKAYSDDRTKLPQVINRLVNAPDIRITHKQKDGTVLTDAVHYGDIMVIVPTNSDVAEYVHILNNAHIPVMAEGEMDFSNCDMLKMLHVAAAAVAAPDDGIAVYAALTGGLFGIPVGELTALRMRSSTASKEERFRISLNSRNNEVLKDAEYIKSALDRLHELHIRCAAVSPAAAMDIITSELKLAAKVSSADLEYFCYAMELIRKAECTGDIKTLSDGAELIGSLLDGTKKEARCISLQKGLDRVRLSNLHKVKGLEAPVVILAAPGGKKKSEMKYSLRTDDKEEFRVFGIKKGNGNYISTSRCEKLREAADARRAAELIRLMYVAATRAKNMLIISYLQNDKSPANCPYWKQLAEKVDSNNEFFDVFKSVNGLTLPSPRPETDAEEIMDNAVCTDLNESECRKETYSISRPSDIKAHKKNDDEDMTDDAPSTDTSPESGGSIAHIPANIAGTMAHRLMEILVRSGGKAECGSVIEEIINDYWHEDKAVSDKLAELWQTMLNGGYTQENGRAADLLGELKDAECHCELPFCTFDKQSGELTNGVMDLVYRKGDKWYIVDYKTNIDGIGLDGKYASQLEAYSNALKTLMGVEAESYIYHLPIHTAGK